MSVYADMSGDWLKNYANLLPEMLEDGVRVMIYAGNLDLICNWWVVKGWTIGVGDVTQGVPREPVADAVLADAAPPTLWELSVGKGWCVLHTLISARQGTHQGIVV